MLKTFGYSDSLLIMTLLAVLGGCPSKQPLLFMYLMTLYDSGMSKKKEGGWAWA